LLCRSCTSRRDRIKRKEKERERDLNKEEEKEEKTTKKKKKLQPLSPPCSLKWSFIGDSWGFQRERLRALPRLLER
jgi:hypothetical protein